VEERATLRWKTKEAAGVAAPKCLSSWAEP
jgi:hypothetical protein